MCMPSRILWPAGPAGILETSGGIQVRAMGWLAGGTMDFSCAVRGCACDAAEGTTCRPPKPAKEAAVINKASNEWRSRPEGMARLLPFTLARASRIAQPPAHYRTNEYSR